MNTDKVRDLIQTATEIVSNSYSEREDVDTLLDKAEQSIFEILEKRTKPSFFKLPDDVSPQKKKISNKEIWELTTKDSWRQKITPISGYSGIAIDQIKVNDFDFCFLYASIKWVGLFCVCVLDISL